MASDTQRVAPAAPGTPELVGPSLIVRVVLRPMTKLLNPLILRRAGRQDFHLAAQIRHVGRRSGRTYATPVTPRRHGDLVLIALTFGSESDWARNVLAAGACSIRIDGEDHDLVQPELLTRQQAMSLTSAAFTRRERAGFQILGIKQVMCLHVASGQ